jgi:hypothetical protein
VCCKERAPFLTRLFVCLFHFTPFLNSISVIFADSFLTIVPFYQIASADEESEVFGVAQTYSGERQVV